MTTTSPTPAAARPLGPAPLAAVLVGGFLGTSLRLGLDLVIPHAPDEVAISTLIVNVAGAFLLGFGVAALWPRLPLWARAGLGAGLLGSFTTFSAMTDSVILLALAADAPGAIITIVATLGLGLTAAGLGIAAGQLLSPRSHAEQIEEETQ